ncbi:MAG: hypothetical protein KAR44_08715 [Candidatus Aegiribacteria sp.]|nr:hypothetical protein [Candidatus Aegiribacteria sp.]
MSEAHKSFVYAVEVRSPDERCVRVCRISGIKRKSQILRKCRLKNKLSLLHGYTTEYDSDGRRSKLEVGLCLERSLILLLRNEGWTVMNPPPKLNSSVYVIELDPYVRRHRDVKRNNPRAKASLPCLYVGQTRRTPEERFNEHNTGEGLKKGGRHLSGKCLKLRKDLYEFYNPMPLLESLILERDLAEELRQQGHTVLGGH